MYAMPDGYGYAMGDAPMAMPRAWSTSCTPHDVQAQIWGLSGRFGFFPCSRANKPRDALALCDIGSTEPHFFLAAGLKKPAKTFSVSMPITPMAYIMKPKL